MRIVVSFLAAVVVMFLSGCAGPENKFGRGMSNLGDIIQGGEMQRSMQQTALWDGADHGPTGFARGFTRTMARTGVGLYEVVTFPIPPYGPVLSSKGKLYPDYSIRTRKSAWGGLEMPESPGRPDGLMRGFSGNGLFETDSSLGFSGGETVPWFPGSKLRVLGY